VSRRPLALLVLALLLSACSTVRQPSGDGPRLRCLNDPGRGGTYSSDRPLFFIFCAESP